jgi:hypothetical protein
MKCGLLLKSIYLTTRILKSNKEVLYLRSDYLMTIRKTLRHKSLPLILAGLVGGCSMTEPKTEPLIDFAQITDLSIPAPVRNAYNFVTSKANRSSRNPSTFSYGANFTLEGIDYEVIAQGDMGGRSLRIKTSAAPHSFMLMDGYGGKPLDGILDYAGLSHQTEEGHLVDSEFKFAEDFQSRFEINCNRISSALHNPDVRVVYSSTN